MARPMRIAGPLLKLKWSPPWRREMPASAAAAEKFEYVLGALGGLAPVVSAVKVNVTVSVQKNPRRTSAADPLKVLCPDQCWGVPPTPPPRAVQVGSPSVNGLPSPGRSEERRVGKECGCRCAG